MAKTKSASVQVAPVLLTHEPICGARFRSIQESATHGILSFMRRAAKETNPALKAEFERQADLRREEIERLRQIRRRFFPPR